jgi:hypothetical protein
VSEPRKRGTVDAPPPPPPDPIEVIIRVRLVRADDRPDRPIPVIVNEIGRNIGRNLYIGGDWATQSKYLIESVEQVEEAE